MRKLTEAEFKGCRRSVFCAAFTTDLLRDLNVVYEMVVSQSMVSLGGDPIKDPWTESLLVVGVPESAFYDWCLLRTYSSGLFHFEKGSDLGYGSDLHCLYQGLGEVLP